MNARHEPNQLELYYREIHDLLNARFNEADVDRTDVQVQSVIWALFEALLWRNERMKLMSQVMRGKTPQQLELIMKEIETCCENPIKRFETIIGDMGLDLDDARVKAAVEIVHEVLNYGQEDECDDPN